MSQRCVLWSYGWFIARKCIDSDWLQKNLAGEYDFCIFWMKWTKKYELRSLWLVYISHTINTCIVLYIREFVLRAIKMTVRYDIKNGAFSCPSQSTMFSRGNILVNRPPWRAPFSVSSRNEVKGGTNHNFVKFPGQNNKYCLFLAIQGGIVPPIPPSGGNTAIFIMHCPINSKLWSFYFFLKIEFLVLAL
jgi:hypothetical protein